MNMRGRDRGFTFIEVLVALALISILALIAAADIRRFYLAYKYYDYAFSMESAVKWARITAMERAVNVGLCVDNDKVFTIRNLGTARNADVCGGTIIRTIRIDQEEPFSFVGSGASFDPRGFAIISGNVCFTDGRKYHRVIISRFGAIRIEDGQGNCS